MRIVPLVSFDDSEQEIFSRLNPYRSVLGVDEKDERSIFGRLLSQVIRESPRTVGGGREAESEPVSFEFLGKFADALRELHRYYEPKTDAAWWRESGAPGADDVLEGLAAASRDTLGWIVEAERIVDEARLAIVEYEPELVA